MNKRISIILGVILGTTIMCANAETVRYWSDGVLYETTSCTDGGDVTLPTTPTPPEAGYVFTGWSVDTYDFSTLNASTNGTPGARYSKGLDGICRYDTGITQDCSNEVYAGLNNGNWRANFSYGYIYGDALCSETSGTQYTAGTPNEAITGKYCWCRVRGYKQAGSHKKTYIPTTSPAWVIIFTRGASNTTNCLTYCAQDCSEEAHSKSGFRSVAFQ